MSYLTQEAFRFVSMALPGNSFGVVDFSTHATLSGLFEIKVNLVSSNADIDLGEVLENPVTVSIVLEKGKMFINCVVREFIQRHL